MRSPLRALVVASAAFTFAQVAALSQTLGPPVLFVHGFCDTAASWSQLETAVMTALNAGTPGSQYPSATTHTLYYDGNTVKLFGSLSDPSGLSDIHSNDRFFAINFYAPGAFMVDSSGNLTIDAIAVAGVSILNKADELAHVIHSITSITNTPSVIVVGHSQGGLVARAYIEGLGSQTQFAALCTDTNNYKYCVPGSTKYAGDISKLITLDTPHGGAATADILAALAAVPQAADLSSLANSVLGAILGCFAVDSLNREELEGTSTFISWLDQDAGNLPSGLVVASVDSYIPFNPPYPLNSDGVVLQNEQSIIQSVRSAIHTPTATLYDDTNQFSVEPANCVSDWFFGIVPFPLPLHLLTCLGIQTQTQTLLATELENTINPSVPYFPPTGIVTAASYKAPIVPGGLASAFGQFPVTSTEEASTLPFPTTLAGLSFQFSGGISAPLSYVSPRQVNFAVPWELAGQTQSTLNVTVNGQVGPSQVVPIADYTPSIFSTNGQGTGQGDIFIGSQLASPSHPAQAGNSVVAIYGTSLGPVTNQPPAGSPGVTSPLSKTTATPTVSIGGLAADVVFSGLSPGTVGLYQVNARVPAGAPGGNAVPVTITIGGVTSNTVTMAIAAQATTTVSLQGISLGAASVTGGASGTATITLSGPAPAGGVQVNLTSSNPAVLQVPPSVTIPAGQSSSTVTFSTTSTGAAATVTVKANLGTSFVSGTITVAVSGPAPQGQEWAHSWGGASTDAAASVAVDPEGNTYVTGATSSFGAGGQDVLVLKYDPSGRLLWTRIWGGPEDDGGSAVAVDSAGNVYIAGSTQSFGYGWADALLLKFDSSGNLIWSRTWGGASFDAASDIAFDPAGNLYVAAESYSLGNCAVLLKFDTNGNLLSSSTWKGPATYDSGYAVDVDKSGNVVLAGTSWDYSVSPNHNSVLVLKYDNQGNLLWNLNIVTGAEDEAMGSKIARFDADGNIIIAGHRAAVCQNSDFSQCNFDIELLKLDPNGNLTWAQSWGGSGWQSAGGLVFDPGGNLIVSGTRQSSLGGTSAALFLKFDTTGSLLDSRTWAGIGGAVGSGSVIDGAGDVILGGSAPNATGGWQVVSGTSGSLSPAVTSPPGNSGTSTGGLDTPTGSTASPTGVLDTGGGAQDALIIKTLTSSTAPAVSLQAISLGAASVTGGASLTGTITLTAPAPSGGVLVNLSSSDPSVQVPATVTVPAGQTTVTFSITTSTVTSSLSVTITAQLPTNLAMGTLTVNATPSPVPSVFQLDGTLNIAGTNSPFEIQGGELGGVWTLALGQMGAYPVELTLGFENAQGTVSGNTLTISAPVIAGLYTNLSNSSQPILLSFTSATLTLTFAGPTQGSAVTGAISFPNGNGGTIQATFAGTVTAVIVP